MTQYLFKRKREPGCHYTLRASHKITAVAAVATINSATNSCHAGKSSHDHPHLRQYMDFPAHSCPQ